MSQLSSDIVFCVMEYLPINNISNALRVCKDWHSVDRYESFWKSIFRYYLVSSIVEKFQQIVKFKVKTTVTTQQIKETLLSSDMDVKKIQPLLQSLRAMKSTTGQKNEPPFVLAKAILQSIITAFDVHVVRDKTALRISLNKSRDEEELKNVSMNGSRFKHLMEQQIISIDSIIMSSYFSSMNDFVKGYKNEIVLNFVKVFMGEENFSHLMINCELKELTTEQKDIQNKIFSNLLKSNSLYSKYWEVMIEMTLSGLPFVLKREYLDDTLRKLFDSYKLNAKLGWISTIFCNIDYYENRLELILELLNKNQFGSEDTVSDIFFLDLFNAEVHNYDTEAHVRLAIKYLKYLENFVPRNQIAESMIKQINFMEFISKLTYEKDEYLSQFLDSFPIPFANMNMITFSRENPAANIVKFLNMVKSKGFIFPQNHIEKLLKKDLWYYSQQSTRIIRYVLDNYQCNVYEFDDRNLFFEDMLKSFSGYKFEEIKDSFDLLFGSDPIDLERIHQNHPTIYTEGISSLLLQIYIMPDPVQFLEFCKTRFVQNIFNLEAVYIVLALQYNLQRDENPYIKKLIYENTMFDDKTKLSDYVSKLLEEKPEWLDEITEVFTSYSHDDPKFAIALYLFCQN